MILSPSGWRKVFAPEERSTQSEVSAADLQIAALAAYLFADDILETPKHGKKVLAVAHDSRPTGPLLAEAACFGLAAAGVEVRFLGLLPIPQLTAHVQKQEGLGGFFYITASHNPVGHNGFKFGLGDGKVLHPDLARDLIKVFRNLLDQPLQQQELLGMIGGVPASVIEGIYRDTVLHRKKSFEDYAQLIGQIFVGKEELPADLYRHTGGIVADMNGSARSVSIDRDLWNHLGIKTYFINNKPGQFAHEILPEGDSLIPCARELLNHSDCILGYVPDCDGDRGNIVIRDPRTRTTRPLEAQELFALCVLSELSQMVDQGLLTYDADGYPEQRVAIVANDPTSLRVDRIAEVFRVPVFRAEVGEANLNALADQLRHEDWFVRLVGEGSNGGNITWPATVRDPLSTLGSVLRLLGNPRLFEIWLKKSGKLRTGSGPPSLPEIIETLPAFVTTPVGSARAVLPVPQIPQARFKALFETLFITTGWNSQKEYLAKQLDIHGWEEINYEGPEERRGFGPPFRSGKETGGLKILLKNGQGRPKGFLWMRGSGTEPVFRVMADIEGNDPMNEEYLMNWFTGMLRKII